MIAISRNKNLGLTVLVVTTVDLALPSACSVHIAAIARGLVARGCRVTLVAPALGEGQAPAIDLVSEGLEVVFTPALSRFGLPRTVNVLAMLGKIKDLVAQRQFSAAYVRFSPLTLLLVKAFRYFCPGATVISEHNGWVPSEASLAKWPSVLCRAVQWLQVKDSLLADMTRVVTQDVANCLIAAGAPSGKIFIAENGADLSHMAPKDRGTALEALGLPSHHLYIGFLGTLTPWQGVEVLIRAAARLFPQFPDLRLLLGGNGPGLEAARALVQELGIAGKVVFQGWVGAHQAPNFVNALDVAVAPYLFPPGRPIGSPVKLRDYAAAGRPVVAANYPVIANVADESWCLLHRPGDDAHLAELLGSLLRDPGKRVAMGASARAAAEQLFGWERVIDTILTHLPPSS